MAIGTPASLGTAGQASGITTTVVVTTSLATAAIGDRVVVFTSGAASQEASGVVDSQGNTYAAVGAFAPAGTTRLRSFTSVLTTGLGLTDTITTTFGSISGVKNVIAVKVAGTTAADIYGAGATGTSTAPSLATGTLNFSDEIIFESLNAVSGGGDSFTEDAAFTTLTSVLTVSGFRLAYKIVAVTTTVTYAPTLGTSRNWFLNNTTFYSGVAPVFTGGTLSMMGV